jgi:hypothetical protein
MSKKTAIAKNFVKYLKQLLRNTPISRFLGHALVNCANGRAEVRLPFRPEFQQN